jgi:hypothetical protein
MPNDIPGAIANFKTVLVEAAVTEFPTAADDVSPMRVIAAHLDNKGEPQILEIRILTPDNVDDDGKDAVAEEVKRILGPFDPVAVAFVAEAWMKAVPKGEPIGLRPSADPESVDTLLITLESVLGNSQYGWRIHTSGAKRELRDPKGWDPVPRGTTGGRFTGFVEPWDA